MAYDQFDPARPDEAVDDGADTLDRIRKNNRALLDQVVGGFAVGWSATPSGGTSARPAEWLFSKGADRLRITQTWGTTGAAAGRLVQAVYARSYDAGSTWHPIATQTLNYTTGGEFAGDTWS